MRLAILLFMLSYLTRNSAKSELNKLGETPADIDLFRKCYEGLGCIEIDSKWYDPKIRPVNLHPLERHIIKTDFLLLKSNKKEPDSLQYNSFNIKSKILKETGFNFNADLVVLIHDFTSNGYTGWIKHLANAIFQRTMDVNVISVDWQRGAEPPYDQAIANARVVALEIGLFLKEIHGTFSYNLGNAHLIGHGVGAHIAGYVGHAVSGIKKITGLDPNGPRFEGMPDIVKLNPSNAKYVEVLHTDSYSSRSQGIRENLGHSDFFINNANRQLGCPENKSFSDLVYLKRTELNEGEVLPGCSHKRSFKYFIEAIQNTECTFLGLKCDSYDNFFLGKCTSCGKDEGDCRTFGNKIYKASSQKVSYYLNIAEKAPFCMFQYKVIIIISQSDKEHFGYFDFILVDEETKATKVTSATENNFRKFNTGNNTSIYYAYPPMLGKVKEAKIRWNEHKKIYCFIYCKQYINVEKVTFKALKLNNKGEKNEIVLCPSNGNSQIDNGAYKAFQRCSLQEKITTTTANSKTITNSVNTTVKPK